MAFFSGKVSSDTRNIQGHQETHNEYVTVHEVNHAVNDVRLQCKRALIHETDTSPPRQSGKTMQFCYIASLIAPYLIAP